jgi:hypothetical protein
MPLRCVGWSALVLAALTFTVWAALSACGKSPGAGANSALGSSSVAHGRMVAPLEAGAAAMRDVVMWTAAREGATEDLASLAIHEGAAGLIEAAAEPELRATALRAMGYARGWAQLPFLAAAASGAEDGDARLALSSAVELGARPRRSEDVEDEAELREGCQKLAALARATDGERPRRIEALRALRMLPCPAEELPTDLDAR